METNDNNKRIKIIEYITDGLHELVKKKGIDFVRLTFLCEQKNNKINMKNECSFNLFPKMTEKLFDGQKIVLALKSNNEAICFVVLKNRHDEVTHYLANGDTLTFIVENIYEYFNYVFDDEKYYFYTEPI